MNPYEPPKTKPQQAIVKRTRRYPIPTIAGFAIVAMVVCAQVAYTMSSTSASWLCGVFAVIACISFVQR